MDGEQRQLFPAGGANRADKELVPFQVSTNAREMKHMIAFRCENCGPLTTLHAL